MVVSVVRRVSELLVAMSWLAVVAGSEYVLKT